MKIHKINLLTLILLLGTIFMAFAEDGSRLWLRYDQIQNQQVLMAYKKQIAAVSFVANSPTQKVAYAELKKGIVGLFGQDAIFSSTSNNTLLIGDSSNKEIKQLIKAGYFKDLGEGFIIKVVIQNQMTKTIIAAANDVGLLYGTFHFLKLLQSQQDVSKLNIVEKPKIKNRILNHWDNLDGTVERGYAGTSIWDWHKLPGYTPTKYTDYARANASIGINGSVLNNVNSNSLSLTKEYLIKTAAIAHVFRPYGIKVYLSARFSAPIEIGGLKTADPLNPEVQQWWKDKVKEVYQYIPDFGGFLVKANSEGQPGPQNYGRNHADGANMLATALKPYNGIVMWRAFVYDDKVPDDRAKQAYNEFKSLDGQFMDNVLVQVKNGAIDFQPREPFHPLFGAMPKTPLMMEFQITQEYLGFSTHLVYLGALFKEVLEEDTYSKGKGSTVSKVITGEIDNHQLTGIAGVANIGSEANWTGHPFAQANWYSFGRLAWNPDLSAEEIASDWIKLTFTNDNVAVNEIKNMMISSREAVVDYMTPLGLHHIMARNHHYGPGPWVKDAGRPDWTSVYYHKADNIGVGFNRTSTGSNALAQYHPEIAKLYEKKETTPLKYLLWFHRVQWNEEIAPNKTLWNAMVEHYYEGVKSVEEMQNKWQKLDGEIDEDRFKEVSQLLAVQHQEAKWWRDACLLYFQSFSKLPLPAGYEKPAHSLEFYEQQRFYFVPGIKN
ncbi:alpha-glucuronidase family glycosyl hydrolase [Pedobacter cryophilus]|uniref:Xylan alpha-1,2-glucuronidase n=1 Tax=Pedobacter cryophilus TaxID=2571271 RepID=A0A4U1BUP1_9SPHI|nr:alpha-glucuronidase family glycosyl hydrolase [Pedobacter cryophilus]TKB95714.1 alpha-glucuronidase [Pedobacter cryophilus]